MKLTIWAGKTGIFLAATLLLSQPSFADEDQGCADDNYKKAYPGRCVGTDRGGLPPIEKPIGPDNKAAEIRRRQQETIAKNKAVLKCKSQFKKDSKKLKACLAAIED